VNRLEEMNNKATVSTEEKVQEEVLK